MYCRKSEYNPIQIFEHINRLMIDAQKQLNFILRLEPFIKGYNGKCLNVRIEQYLKDRLPDNYRIRSGKYYDNFRLYINIPVSEEKNDSYEIYLGSMKETNRYNHDNYLNEIEKLKLKLKQYGDSLDKLNAVV